MQSKKSDGTSEPANDEKTTFTRQTYTPPIDDEVMTIKMVEMTMKKLLYIKIVSRCKRRLVKHGYADVGNLFYLFRWYEDGPADGTLDPIAHIQRSKYISTHNRKGLPLLSNFDDSIDG